MDILTNKTFLITGAGKGIGFHLAEALHELGASLILHTNSTDSMARIQSRFSLGQHTFFQADFSSPENLEDLWKKQISGSLKIDGYVHCVGIRSRRPINMLKTHDVMQVMTANFASYVEMIRLVTRKNTYNPGLSIVGISSISAHAGGSGITAYAASKAAMEAATRCLAKELYKKEIRVNTVVCGQIETEAYQTLMESKDDQTDKVLERQYLGLGKPSQVTDIILFLLSEKSAFITGSAIPADGGYLTT